MRVKTEYSVLLMCDWGSSNDVVHFSPIAILESATEEKIREILASKVLPEWNFDDAEAEDFLNEVVPIICNEGRYMNEDYEVDFKLESAPLFE
jgi:hypothetical protein